MSRILPFILLLFTFASNAQNNNYHWTERKESPAPYASIKQMIGSDTDGYYVLWSGKQGTSQTQYWLESIPLDMSNSTVTEFPFVFGAAGSVNNFDQAYRLNRKNYITYASYRKEEAKNALYIQEVDAAGKRGNEIEIGSVVTTKIMNKGGFKVSLSPDQTKVVVLSYDPYDKKAGVYGIKMSCFNTTDFSEIWSRYFDIPTASQKNPTFDIRADNDGNVVVYNRVKEGKLIRCALYGYNATEDEFKTFDLGLQGTQFVIDHKLTITPEGEIVFHATYFEEYKMNLNHPITGRIYTRIQNAREQNVLYAKPLSEQLVATAGVTEQWQSTPYIAFQYIRNIFVRDDGKIIILLEYHNKQKAAVPNSNPAIYEDIYYDNAILTLCVNPTTGALDWSHMINKSQKITSQENSKAQLCGSFAACLQGNAVQLIYNEFSGTLDQWRDTDNNMYKKTEVFGKMAKYSVFKYSIEEDGSVTYNELKYGLPMTGMFNVENRYPLTMQSKNVIHRNNELFIYADYKGVQYRYCKIAF